MSPEDTPEAQKPVHGAMPLDIIIKYATEDRFDLKNPKVVVGAFNTSFELFYQAIILASSSIGISALAYPTSMANTGIVLWLALLVIAIAINQISSHFLIYCGKETGATDFGDLTQRLLGWYKVIVDILVALMNIGIIISCMLTFNDFMTSIFNHEYFHTHHSRFITSKKSLFWIVFPNLLLLPLLLRRSARDVNAISVCSVFAIVMLACFTIYIFIYSHTHVVLAKLEVFNVANSAQCFSLLLFGYMNQQTILDVYAELRCKRTETVTRVIKIQNIIISFVYITIALFGYLTFYNHKDVKDKNIFAFDLERNFFYMVVNLCVAFSVLLSNVGTFRPTKDLILSYCDSRLADIESRKRADLWVMLVLQLGLIVASCMLEVYDMNFLNIIDFVSVFISPTLCIYLPVCFYVMISKNYRFLLLAVAVAIANTVAIVQI